MAVIFLDVVAVELLLMKLNAKAAPKPTSFAVTVPSAFIAALPLWVAVAVIEPTVSNPPEPALPIAATVSLETIAIATAGLTAIPPAAPAFTLVSVLLSESADRDKAPTLLRETLS